MPCISSFHHFVVDLKVERRLALVRIKTVVRRDVQAITDGLEKEV